MKRGQEKCKEPKCRQRVLITGKRNMPALMSVYFYLETKTHLCCPDPFLWSISEQKWDMHAHTHRTEGSFPQQKEPSETRAPGLYLFAEAENQPQGSATDSSPCVGKGGTGLRRHLHLGNGGLRLCLWVTDVNMLCISTPGHKSAPFLVMWTPLLSLPPPQLPNISAKEQLMCRIQKRQVVGILPGALIHL